MRIKKPLALVFIFLLAATFMAGNAYADFAGKNIAVITGVLTYSTTEKIGGIPVVYFESSAAAEDVKAGRVDGFMHALSLVQVMADEFGNDEFEVVALPKDIFSAQIGAFSHEQAIVDRFNMFLGVIKADGTLDEMKSRWFGSGRDLSLPMPEIANSRENGIFTTAICSDSTPYVFIGSDGNYTGFSVELALRFGAYEKRAIEFADMEFAALIPYIADKKADFGLANMAITEERGRKVLFTDPYFDEQHGILVLKKSGQGL